MSDNRPQYENRSRLGLATPAIRPGMKGRMLLAGPAGSGKTYTALLIAMTLREHTDTASVVMIDTEKDSGRTYADEFLLADGSPAYKHISWAAPFNATDLAMTLRDASGKYDVVIVDSQSHFWRGAGGVLDVAGGRWTGWSEARPMHTDMVDAILSCDCHVLLCARMTQEHTQQTNDRGKIEVVKLGMKIQQDADLEYEMNVALELDMSHTMRVTKSRTRAVPVGKEYIAGHAEEFGGQYREWLRGGEPAASKDQVDNLVATLNRIEDPANRMRSKQRFVETFGRPEMLLVSRLGEAAEWVANAVLGNEPPPDRAPDAVPSERDDVETVGGEQPVERGDTAPSPVERGDTAPTVVEASTSDPGRSDGTTSGLVTSGGDTLVWPVLGGGSGTVDTPDIDSIQHESDVEGPTVFNGDTGHCSECGGPIWYDARETEWHHADEVDMISGHRPAPAGPGIDVDALYAAAHPVPPDPKVRRLQIEVDVSKMSQTKVLQALGEAGLPIDGSPKTLKLRLVDHLAAQ